MSVALITDDLEKKKESRSFTVLTHNPCHLLADFGINIENEESRVKFSSE